MPRSEPRDVLMREWNATTYHRISSPLADLGLAVLARVPLAGDEVAVDLGCGTGRVTRELAGRVPRGRVIGIDRSTNMLTQAKSFLGGRAGAPIRLVLADALALPLHGSVDVIFSTATLHWVRDHPRLFAGIFDALRSGGRFVAQCGGGPNIARLRQRMDALLQERSFDGARANFRFPWEFADAETTAARLTAAGFGDVTTFVERAPIVQRDADAYREFLKNVICGPYLMAMSHDRQRTYFLDRLTNAGAADDPPFELDYCRLNMAGRKN
jgi:trans-aconitate methyltransferase